MGSDAMIDLERTCGNILSIVGWLGFFGAILSVSNLMRQLNLGAAWIVEQSYRLVRVSAEQIKKHLLAVSLSVVVLGYFYFVYWYIGLGKFIAFSDYLMLHGISGGSKSYYLLLYAPVAPFLIGGFALGCYLFISLSSWLALLFVWIRAGLWILSKHPSGLVSFVLTLLGIAAFLSKKYLCSS
jgi:hypothetical protein